MQITKELLLSLDYCEEIEPNLFRLKTPECHFLFRPNGEYTWSFSYLYGDGESKISHSVTDLEECFGFIAKDSFILGKDAFRRKIKSLLTTEVER